MANDVIGRLKALLELDKSKYDNPLDNSQKKTQKNTSLMGSSFKKLGSIIAASFAVGAITKFVSSSVKAYKVQEDAERKLSAVIKSTGMAAGLTADEIKSYAAELQKVTTFGDEVTINAAAIAATFKSVRGENFKGMLASAQDLVAVMGGDLNSAVLQLGKALEQPEIGLSMLRRSGISFSTQQIAQIKQLVSEGKKHEAQIQILAEVQSQFGGAAKAAAETASGAAIQASNAWGDFKEILGASVLEATNFTEVLRTITGMLTTWMSTMLDLEQSGLFSTQLMGLDELASKMPNANALLSEYKKRLEGLQGLELDYNWMSNFNFLTGGAGVTIETEFGKLSGEEAENYYAVRVELARELQKRINAIELDQQKKTAVERLALESKTVEQLQQLRDSARYTTGTQTDVTKFELSAIKAAISERTVVEQQSDEARIAATKASEEARRKEYEKTIEFQKKSLASQLDDHRRTNAEYSATSVYLEKELSLVKQLQDLAQSGVEYENYKRIGEQIQKNITYIEEYGQKKGLSNLQIPEVTPSQMATTMEVQGTEGVVNDILAIGDSWDVVAEKALKAQIASKEFSESVSQSLESGAISAFSGLGDAIGKLATGDTSGAWQAILSPIANMITQLGELAIATGIGLTGIEAAFKTRNPALAIAAGVALVALGSMIGSAISNIGSGMSSSGGSYGTTYSGGSGFSGSTTSYAPAYTSDPVEVHVTGEISGQNIALVNQRYNYTRTR